MKCVFFACVFVSLGLLFSLSHAFESNDATQCNFLNGQIQLSGPGNILTESQVVDNQYFVSLQRSAQLKDGTFSKWSTDVTVMDFFYRQQFSSIHTEWYDQQNSEQAEKVLLSNNQTTAISISNVVLLSWNDTTTLEHAPTMATSFAMPYFPSNRQYSQVAVVFNKPLVKLDFVKHYQESVATYFAKKFIYTYPFDSTYNEPIYNSQGQIIGTQQIDATSSMIENTVNGTINFDANLFQVKLFPAQVASTTTLEFVVLATTQNSIKLSKYNFDTLTGTTTQQWASLLLPNIADSDVVLAEQPQAWNNYIRINRDPEQRDLYVVIHIHKNQQAAFLDNLHLPITFSPDKIVTPVLLRIDVTSGKVVFALNLYSVAVADVTASNTLFVTNLDTLNGYVLLTGTVNPAQSLLNSNPQFNGIFNTFTWDKVQQKSFIVRLQFSKDRSIIQSTLSKVIPGHVSTEEEKSGNIFTGLGISFALDNNVERIVVGGYYGGVNATTEMVARGLLLTVNATGTFVQYPMLLDDMPSTSIRHVKRSFILNSANYFYFAFVNGLNFAPSGSAFQRTSANFWNLDCSSPNYQMELATTILFFVLFGVISSTLIVVVAVNLILCVVSCIKKVKSNKGAGYAKIQ